jgi:hypothetical protein
MRCKVPFGWPDDSLRTRVALVAAMAFALASLPTSARTQSPPDSQSAPRQESSQPLSTSGGALRGTLTAPRVNGIYVVDGTIHPTVASAIAECLASSESACSIDARGSGALPKPAACTSGSDITTCPDYIGSFDPVRNCTGTSPQQVCWNVPLTLELGPWGDYVAGTITLEKGTRIIGSGSQGFGRQHTGTIITAAPSSNAPILVISQNNTQAATNVHLQGLTFYGSEGNTSQDGADLECVNTTGSGMFNSVWENVNFYHFMGDSIHLACSPKDYSSAIQFTSFINVSVVRPAGAGYGLYMGGSVGNDQWIGGIICSVPPTDTTGPEGAVNVYMGTIADGSSTVYSQSFYGVTVQGGRVLINFNGATLINLNNMHHEGQPGITNGYLFTRGGAQNGRITMNGGFFVGTIGQGPDGYIFNTRDSGNALTLNVADTSWGNPTNVVIGSTPNRGQVLIFNHNFPNMNGKPPVTNGVAPTIMASETLDARLFRFANVQGSTPITNIHSYLMSGELLILRSISDDVRFVAGDRLNLDGARDLDLRNGESATFTFNDATSTWDLVALGRVKDR